MSDEDDEEKKKCGNREKLSRVAHCFLCGGSNVCVCESSPEEFVSIVSPNITRWTNVINA